MATQHTSSVVRWLSLIGACCGILILVFAATRWFKVLSPQPSYGISYLPLESNTFIQRSALWDALTRSSTHRHTGVNFSKFGKRPSGTATALTACSGLGGVGKTRLALFYAHHTPRAYTLKIWLDAEDSSRLAQQCTTLALAWGYVPGSSTTPVAYFKEWLAQHPGWLLIFDNAPSYETIKSFLPPLTGHVMITSRCASWPSNFECIPVDVMSPAEADHLLTEMTGIKDQQNAKAALAKLVDYLPLALMQAGAYIAQTGLDFHRYIQLYHQHQGHLLSHEAALSDQDSAVEITWDITLKKLSPLTQQLLGICAYMAPDGLDRSLLVAWLKAAHPELNHPNALVDKHLKEAAAYSMITYDGHRVKMHRVLQQVLRFKVHTALRNHQAYAGCMDATWLENLVTFLLSTPDYFPLGPSYVPLFQLYRHLLSLWGSPHPLASWVELEIIMANIFWGQERYDDFYTTVIGLRESLKSNNSIGLFYHARLAYLASAYKRYCGQYQAAQDLLDKAWQLCYASEKNPCITPNDYANLKAKIAFNQANLTFIQHKRLYAKRESAEKLSGALHTLEEAVKVFHTTGNQRDFFRSLELMCRILNLQNKGKTVLTLLQPYTYTWKHLNNPRLDLFFLLTYAQAYGSAGQWDKALSTYAQARCLAETLNLHGILTEIIEGQQRALQRVQALCQKSYNYGVIF